MDLIFGNPTSQMVVLFICSIIKTIHNLQHGIENSYFGNDVHSPCIILMPHTTRM